MFVNRKSLSKVIAVLACLAGAAHAQSAGGFSAGPGLASPQTREVPPATEPAPCDPGAPNASGGASTATCPSNPPADAAPAGATAQDPGAKGTFRTDIHSYKPSPVFTQVRQFATTRLWVLDPGQYTVEQWWTGQFGAPRAFPGATNTGDQFFQTEIEIGLRKHVQLDLYFNYQFNQDSSTGSYRVSPGGHTGVAAEVRIALGDFWGQIWGNPTLYFELTSQYYNSPRAEARLLLGGSLFIPKLLGALNLAFERNIFRDSGSGIDYEIKADYGINYELIPDALRAGVEGVLGFDSHGVLDNLGGGIAIGAQNIYPVAQVGPSLVLMEPSRRFKVLATFLFGLAQYDPPYQPTVILSSSF
jgi:hypothetical protein